MTPFEQLLAQESRMVLPVVLLAVLPGLGLAAVFARRVKLSWPETIVASFALTVAVTSVVATLCHLVGLPLDMVVVAYLGLIPVSLWFFAREILNGHLSRPALEWQALVLAVATGWAAMYERPWFRSDADTFYHLAASRSLLVTGRPLVTDPFHGTGTRVLDPTSGVWHTIQAVLSRALDTDIATLYVGITALSAGLIVLAFWVLARRVSGNAWAASLATIAMAAVAYHFDFRLMAYPKHLSQALLFLGIALLVRLLEEPVWPLVGLAAVVGVATTTMHLAAAQFFFLTGSVLLTALAAVRLYERVTRGEWRLGREFSALGVTGVLTAALSVPILLPKVGALSGSSVMGADSYLDLADHVWHVGGMALVKLGGMYTGGPLVFFPMLVLAALAVRPAFRDGDTRALAALALVAMIPLLLNDPLVTPLALRFSSYMTMRMAILMRFMPFVAIAWALGRSDGPRKWLVRGLAVVAIALAVAGAWGDLTETFTGVRVERPSPGLDVYGLEATRNVDMRRSWGPVRIKEMRALFGNEYPVVAAEDHTGYYLAGLLPVSIVSAEVAHSPAAIEKVDGPKRRADMDAFFAPMAGEAERREIAERYGVRYVAIWKERLHPEVEQGMLRQTTLFRLAKTSRSLDLLEVVPR